MNRRFVLYLLGWLLLLDCAFLGAPLLASLVFGESIEPWAAVIALAGVVGVMLVGLHPPTDRLIRPRDGFLIVSGSWLAVVILASELMPTSRRRGLVEP